MSWAGALLLIVAATQLGALATAWLLDAEALVGGRATRLVTASVASLFALQALAAVAVLRLWRWWRGIAMVLCLLGIALQGANLMPPFEPMPVVAINAGLALGYLLVLTLLSRSGEAFA